MCFFAQYHYVVQLGNKVEGQFQNIWVKTSFYGFLMSYITYNFVFYNCLTTSVNPWNHRDIKQCRLFYSELQKLQIQEDLLVSKLDSIACSNDFWTFTENIWKKCFSFQTFGILQEANWKLEFCKMWEKVSVQSFPQSESEHIAEWPEWAHIQRNNLLSPLHTLSIVEILLVQSSMKWTIAPSSFQVVNGRVSKKEKVGREDGVDVGQ